MSENKKGLKEWALDMEKDENLAQKFKNVEKAEDVVKIAKSLGYDFTEDELMDLKMEAVSGGFAGAIIPLIGTGLKIGGGLAKTIAGLF